MSTCYNALQRQWRAKPGDDSITRNRIVTIALLLAIILPAGCLPPDQRFIRRMDSRPPDKQPKNWAITKALMARTPPEVGQPAPDFTLQSRDGSETVTRSQFQGKRPLVLIFGSYT